MSPSPPTENESKEKQKSRQCHPLTANAGSRDYGIQALLKMPDNIPAIATHWDGETLSSSCSNQYPVPTADVVYDTPVVIFSI